MIGFLRIQYALGNVSDEQIRNLIGVLLTEDDYRLITGKAEEKV